MSANKPSMSGTKASWITDKLVRDYLEGRCRGRANALHGREVIEGIVGYTSVSLERDLSEIVKRLRDRGFPVCSDSSNGYWWGVDPSDVAGTISFLWRRAMHSLRQVTKLRKIAMPDVSGQIRLPVGSEPALPGDWIEQSRQVMRDRLTISLLIQTDEELHAEALRFLDAHPDWDEERLYLGALALFLLQQGVQADSVARAYLAAFLGKEEGDAD